MKVLWVIFIAFTLSSANEIQRVDDILNDISQLRVNYKKSQNKIIELKKIIQKQQLLLVKKTVVKTKIIPKQIIFSQCEEPNPFPKLMMKEDDKIHSFKASAFRVNKSASIYNAINGREIVKWEKNTSFTSDKKTTSMIKITGYFVDKVWTPASKEMWIKVEDATQR
jgi:hypothetical protein